MLRSVGTGGVRFKSSLFTQALERLQRTNSMKQVGLVTAKQFGYVFIGGVPYLPTKVKRFMAKGLGIKVQDLVIFDFDMIEGQRVLSYLKNAVYADVDEIPMVKEFVKSSELKMEDLSRGDISDQIKKDLAEEGCSITNDGVITNIPPEFKEQVPEIPQGGRMDIDPEVLKLIAPDQRRQLAIMLQSSLKIAAECKMSNSVFADALMITRWVDRNSTRFLALAEEYIESRRIAYDLAEKEEK